MSAAGKMPSAGHERAAMVAEMEDLQALLDDADDAGQAARLRSAIVALKRRIAADPGPRR